MTKSERRGRKEKRKKGGKKLLVLDQRNADRGQ